MSENQPDISSRMSATDRCSSPQNLNLRKSSRLLKTALNANLRHSNNRSNQAILHAHQDSTISTAASSATLHSPTAPDDVAGTSSGPSTAKYPAATVGPRTRKWKAWDPGTENLFFDALKMHGKDYDAITKYITQKSKSSRGNAKNYEQVRNYYHNTASKLLSLLNLSGIDASKEVKELFALINYGEWKRKTNSAKLNAKRIKIFNDLVLNGWTTVKVATRVAGKACGRKLRTRIIRTPMCPALRKYVEGRDDVTADTNVPKTVAIELSPSSQRDRAYVLGCWQNPCLRFVLNLNQPVGEILRWLQQKWIPQDLKMKKLLLGEDITNELPDLVLYPSVGMVLRTARLSPIGARTVAVATATNAPAAVGTQSPAVILGLRHCFGGGSSGVLPSERREQRGPLSPGKADRRRKKSTPAANEDDRHLSSAETNSVNKVKRVKRALTSPVQEQEENDINAMPKQFSDGESSCDAYPVVAAAAVETDDERDRLDAAGDPLLTAKKDFMELTTDKLTFQPQQCESIHGVVVSPEQLRLGITVNTCESLTVGQLYLMCGKAVSLHLKYSITPKSANPIVDAQDAWQFFVNLVRSEFVDTLQRKLTTQSSSRPHFSPVVRNSAAVNETGFSGQLLVEGTSHAMASVSAEPVSRSSAMEAPTSVTTHVVIDSHDVAADAVFAAPAAGRPAKKRKVTSHRITTSRNMHEMNPPRSVQLQPVASESRAFLAQIGQMQTKKPVVVNRRCAVVTPAARKGNRPPVPSYSTTHQSVSQSRNPEQAILLVVSQGSNCGQSSVEVSAGTKCSFESACGSFTPEVTPENAGAVPCFGQLGANLQMQSSATTSAALNTPDVSLMNVSSDQSIVTSTNETCTIDRQQGETVTPVTASTSESRQDIITSDSFLDFSLGSFPGFGLKLSHTGAEKGAISNVIHSLRMETDDTALSSPPRPIRPNVNAQNKASLSDLFQMGGVSNLDPCQSTSNLLSLLDAAAENEPSNTCNFFASCAAASVLETPEKCKNDDRA